MDIHQIFGKYFEGDDIAPVATLLSKRLEEGNICVYASDEGTEAASLPPWSNLKDSPWVGSPDSTLSPFILDNERIYLQRYWTYETAILDKIRTLLSSPAPLPSYDEIAALPGIEHPSSPTGQTEETDWQRIAILHALKYRLTIITGGPGTGKTTTVARLLGMLYQSFPTLSAIVAAPTGKAAARMNESLKNASVRLELPDDTRQKLLHLEASTIHRLLGYHPATRQFRYNAQRRLPYTLFVIDEASMLDAHLFAQFMIALPDDARLVLVGDRNQLSAVGAGSIFGDLCRSAGTNASFPEEEREYYRHFMPHAFLAGPPPGQEPVTLLSGHVIELQHSHRFDPSKGIGLFSRHVLHGEADPGKVIQPFLGQDTALTILPDTTHRAFEELLRLYEAYAREEDTWTALKKRAAIRTLCTTHDGPRGTKALNLEIEAYLRKRNLLGTSQPFYHNQPILITVNDYHLGLYNGDEGLIRRHPDTGELMAWFEGEEEPLRSFAPSMLQGYVTAFAMSIHKSQGSEFDTVIVVLPDRADHRILTRELLYTAVTRAKNKALLIGSEAILLEAIINKIERMSGVIPRLTHSPSQL